MRTEAVKIYLFAELNDKAKEKARQWWRSLPDCLAWNEESRESIKTFCDHFGVKMTDWSVGPHQHSYVTTNEENHNFRGIRLSQFDRDHMPTGYCLDCDLWQTFYDEFKKTGAAKKAFRAAIDAAVKAWQEDMEYQLTDESIDETIEANKYEFLEDGSRW